MIFFKRYIGDLFVSTRFYVAGAVCVVLFIVSFFVPVLGEFAWILFGVYLLLVLADYAALFLTARKVSAKRIASDRLSNGDENIIEIQVKNPFLFTAKITVIDELPLQLQERNFSISKIFSRQQQQKLQYTVTPTERGEYDFGNILLFVMSPLRLIIRRFAVDATETIRVYPSFLHLRNYQLVSHTPIEGGGNKRVRKVGQSMEFEQIKDYVNGDDIRTINWKATARKGLLMVNSYVDEKSQQVYCIIDKGRLMKMPFGGLSLLDYAINSVLALNNVCLQKQDKIGLITYSNKMGAVVAANRKPIQRELVMQALYKENTDFQESDFELLYTQVRRKIKQRSLLILYTNFESLNGLQRQVNYLRSIARHHLLMVVFFENTELTKLSGADAQNVDDVYVKTIAEKFVFEKKLVVKELQKYGILSVLSSPENLTVNSINKYLELKAKQAV